MLSAFKRLASGKADGSCNVSARPAHQSMPTTLQKKFAKGVQYNMKIIIKGDRNVGKTCLFYRLQGKKFIEEYLPTEEIQVASIQWNYKATDDIVKVEVWDVVDRGRRRRKLEGLKMDNAPSENVVEEPALDAEFLDVYKGTNGVIIVMDITKTWTFDYVQRELPKIPTHIPVIVLGNHCDMAHHRTVTTDHVTYFIDSLEERRAQVRYAESSMRNGFGLKLLHKFFNLPFLQLQRETLLKQLDTNEEETRLTIEELDLFQDSDDADYNKFLDNLVNRRRALADSVSSSILVPNVTSSLRGQQTSSTNGTVPAISGEVRRSTSIPGPIGAGTPIPVKGIEFKAAREQQEMGPVPSSGTIGGHVASLARHSLAQNSLPSGPAETRVDAKPVVADAPSQTTVDKRDSQSQKSQSLMSKIFGNNKKDEELQQQQQQQQQADFSRCSQTESLSSSTSVPLTSLEDFVPDDCLLDRSFLDDNSHASPEKVQREQVDSESDTETGNPLVAGYEDDLSSAEETCLPVQPKLSENPLSKQKHKSDDPPRSDLKTDTSGGSSKRNSVSSLEMELRGSATFQGNPPGQEISSDAFDSWLRQDSKWRQSPEGGEDVSTSSTRKDRLELSDKSLDASVTSSNVHLDLLDSSSVRRLSSNGSSPVLKEKKKHKEKAEDKEKKKKKKSKERENVKKDRGDKCEKKKKRGAHQRSRDETRERDELEEFLNGSATRIGVDAAYEAI